MPTRALPRSVLLPALLCALAAAPSPAPAQTADVPNRPAARARFAIIDPALLPTVADVESFSVAPDGSGVVSVRAADGTLSERPLAGLLAIVPAWWADLAEPPVTPNPFAPGSLLELADGQRWPGSLDSAPSSAPAEPDAPVVWRHARLGTLAAPLDVLSRFAASGSAPSALAPDAAGADAALLRNGDRLTGVIDALGSVLRFAPARGADAATVDSSQVVEARFANPPQLRRGPYLWFIDGTMVRAAAVAPIARSQFAVVPANAQHPAPHNSGSFDPDAQNVYRLEELLALAPGAGRLTALADLHVERTLPVAPLLFADPIVIRVPASGISPLGAHEIEIPGPMTVEWTLPARARRLSLVARLADDGAGGGSGWGECTLSLWAGPSASASGPRPLTAKTVDLTPSAPAARIDFEFPTLQPGARLFLRLDPGSRGPIQDRVRLTRAVLLTEPAPN